MAFNFHSFSIGLVGTNYAKTQSFILIFCHPIFVWVISLCIFFSQFPFIFYCLITTAGLDSLTFFPTSFFLEDPKGIPIISLSDLSNKLVYCSVFSSPRADDSSGNQMVTNHKGLKLRFTIIWLEYARKMLTKQEKERLVVEFYNQGKTVRDIAKELRMSFRDIGAILKKVSREMEEKQNIDKSLSPSTQAYRLFSKGKTPIDIAITLNLSEAETTKYYEEYWELNHMHELRMVYDEIGYDIANFLKLYKLSRSEHMDPEHVVNLLQLSNEYLPLLEQKYKRLKREIGLLEYERQELQNLGNQVSVLTKVLEKTRWDIKNLNKEKTRLETRIGEIRNGDQCRNIRQAAEEGVTNSLSKRKDLLELAVFSVTESIMRDPTKYNILVGSAHGRQYAVSQPYIDVYRALILDEAQRLFELMVRESTSTIVSNVTYT
jgi:hypothetical protein